MKTLEEMTSKELFDLATTKAIEERKKEETWIKSATLKHDLYWAYEGGLCVEWSELFIKEGVEEMFKKFKLCCPKGTTFYLFKTHYGKEWRDDQKIELCMDDFWAEEHLENIKDVEE